MTHGNVDMLTHGNVDMVTRWKHQHGGTCIHQHFYDHFYGVDHSFFISDIPITFINESSDSVARQKHCKLILKTMTPLMAPFLLMLVITGSHALHLSNFFSQNSSYNKRNKVELCLKEWGYKGKLVRQKIRYSLKDKNLNKSHETLF